MTELVSNQSFAFEESTRRPVAGACIGSDDRMPAAVAMRLLEQFVHNLSIFKVRVLARVDVPLTPDEDAVALHDDRSALARVGAHAMEEVRLIEESLRKGSYELTEGRVLDSVNGVYRFAFEEIALRWSSCEDDRQARAAPVKMLTTAVDHQRKLADVADESRRKAELKAKALEQELADVKRRLDRVETEKRDDFDAYLKEVCVLKEQLYRSYKDKDYVGKPVDMLRLVLDKDTGEDVSVDSLLDARRMMRSAEQEAVAMKERIQGLTADVSSKTRMAKRAEERLKASESIVQTLQGDVETLSGAIGTLEDSLNTSQAQVARLETAVKHHERREKKRVDDRREGEAQTDKEETPVSRFDYGAERIPHTHRERSRLELFTMYADKVLEVTQIEQRCDGQIKAAEEQVKAAEGRLGTLRDELEALQDKYDETCMDLAVTKASLQAAEAKVRSMEAENERLKAAAQDALDKQHQAEELQHKAEADRDEAIAAQRRAEDRAEEAVLRCATNSQQLTRELETAGTALDVAHKRNAALCTAYLNISERLEEIKTRAGLKDYKRRANEFHVKRAEVAIAKARAEMEAHEAECVRRVTLADNRTEHAHEMLRFAEADVVASAEAHAVQMRVLQERTAAVQEAFEALLQDFNRLRDDYLKTAGSAAKEYMTGWAATTHSASQGAGGDDGDSQANSRSAQRFVFEQSAKSGDTSMLAQEIHAFAETLAQSTPGKLIAVSTPTADDDGNNGPSAPSSSPAVVNAAASALASHASKRAAAMFLALHESLLKVLRMDKFIESKETAIRNAERAAVLTEKGEPMGKSVSARPGPKRNARRKTMAEEHAQFAAEQAVDQQKAGLENQRVMNAWAKLRIFADVDATTREFLTDTVAMFEFAQLQDLDNGEMPAELPKGNAAGASSPDEEAAIAPAALSPVASLRNQRLDSPSGPAQSPQSAARSLSTVFSPGALGGTAVQSTRALEREWGVAAMQSAAGPTLAGSSDTAGAKKRVGSAQPSATRSAGQWGASVTPKKKAGLLPSITPHTKKPTASLPAARKAMTPGPRLDSTRPGLSDESVSLLIPESAKDAPCVDACFGDHEQIAGEIDALRKRLVERSNLAVHDGSKPSASEPAWKRQKERIRKAQSSGV